MVKQILENILYMKKEKRYSESPKKMEISNKMLLAGKNEAHRSCHTEAQHCDDIPYAGDPHPPAVGNMRDPSGMMTLK